MPTTKTAKAAGAKAANPAKQGQKAKQAATVTAARSYPKVPKGFGCHGMYNAAGQLTPAGVVPAVQAMYASPRKLGLNPSVGIPSANCPVVMCPIQPGMGSKYQSAYAVVAAAHAAACKANKTQQPTVAQLNAHIAPWPSAKPKANSALRHVARTLGIAWSQPK